MFEKNVTMNTEMCNCSIQCATLKPAIPSDLASFISPCSTHSQ